MGLTLRPYQSEAVAAIEREWHEGRDRTLLVLPTGTGKTVVFASVIRDMCESGSKCLVVAHREELLAQAEKKIEMVAGVSCVTEKAESHTAGSTAPVTIASVQSIGRENRLQEFAPDEFGVIVIDEAHHTLAQSYRNVIDHFSMAHVLGVTATPDRGDRKALGEVYDSIAYELGLAKAINDGYLARIVAKTAPVKIDASGLKKSHGDYTPSSAAEVVGNVMPQVADVIAEAARTRHVCVFMPLVQIAKDMARMLVERGVSAEEVDGESEDRADVLSRFESGQTRVVVNAMLLTEGWDAPICDCIVVLRPTESRALYAQMVGRGTRPCEGKENLLLLDFLWLTGKHRLCQPASLFADTDEKQAKMQRHIEDGEEHDLMEAEEQAERDVLAERENALAERLEAARRKGGKTVDVVQFELSIGSEALAGYEPMFAWQLLPPTDKQVRYLTKMGMDASGLDRGKASLLMDVMMQRQDAGMATPRQVRQLERAGFRHPGMWTFAEASDMMGRLSAVGWKPYLLGFSVRDYVPDSMKGAAA
jgi:superfamily II DNA or RNA helicase